MKTKSKKKPTLKQLRARAKLVKMVKARARAARAAKRLAGKKPARKTAKKAGRRNTTVIKARKISHLDVSKVHNPRRGSRKALGGLKRGTKFYKERKLLSPKFVARADMLAHANLTPKQRKIVLAAMSKAQRKQNGAGLARKRRQEFVGRPSRSMSTMYAPKGSAAPKTVTLMGKLHKLHIKNGPKLNLQGVPSLAHHPKTDQLYVLGKNYQVKGRRRNPGEGFEELGEITRIEYEAVKTHLGDTEPVTYYHDFGEEGGERPTALINEEGLLLIEGGDYYITPEGIRD